MCSSDLKVIERIDIYDPSTFNPNGQTHILGSNHTYEKDNFDGLMRDFERSLLNSTLQRFAGDKNAAMSALKLPRATFYRKLAQLGITH